ncbi:TMhelix containing protein [Vibrio phage 1.189.B._10N.286.51.B5]|nr:TMhelix containing protein [Vibrio phage 1.189.B._10N.286.51.B5]AUR93912.1 coil containing protein [Vibrio phage 1.189.C._10N.286.51.B5]AUR93978.1 TMhelix containing protein [Vibrio phage 1.189.O._10N.286.51.B5]
MPTIKRFSNETDFEVIEVDNIGQYMIDNIEDFKQGYRLYDNLVATDGDITEDAERIISCDNVIMLRPANGPVAWVVGAVVAAVVAGAAAVYLLTPKVEAQAENRTQGSSTNALGSRENTARIGEREDDIYGKVSAFVPSLIQVPHAEFVDNQEVEYFAMACRGRGLIENVRDGDSKFENLDGGKFNAWNPGGNPNDGTPADFTIGGAINRPLVNVQQATELQSAELLPPNDSAIGGVTEWLVTSGTNTASLVLSNYQDLEVDLREHFTVGADCRLVDCVALVSSTTKTLYWSAAGDNRVFTIPTSVENLDGTYEILAVGASSLSIDTSDAFWQVFNSSPIIRDYFSFTYEDSGFSSTTTDPEILDRTWYGELNGSVLSDKVISINDISSSPNVGQAFDEFLGPIEAPGGNLNLVFNFVADSGFYKIVKSTDTEIDADLEIRIQPLDANGDPDGFVLIEDVTFTSNQDSVTRQAAITHTSVHNSGQYGAEIIVRRKTDRDKSDNVTNVDKVYWRDLYYKSDIATPDYGDRTIMQAVIPSTITSRSVKNRQLNLDWTRYITPYQAGGTFGALQPIDTWAEVLIALALDQQNGRLTIDQIDAELLLDVQQELIDYYCSADYVKIGYDMDSTKLRFQDIYTLFCNSVNVKPYSQGGVFKAYADIKRDFSTKQFTHRNKIPNTDSKERTYETEYDGVELTYRSNETGQFEEIIKHVNGIDSVNRLTIELSGATEEIQAETRALRELNIIKYQKLQYIFEADGIARLTVPGERVDNVDNTRIVKRENNLNTYNVYDGQVQLIDNLTVQLSEPVEFTDGETHSIRFTNLKGELLETIDSTEGSTPYHVVLSQSPSEALYTGYKKEKTNFTFASDSSRQALPVIIKQIDSKNTNGMKTRQMTAINFDERYYKDDQTYGA